MRPVARLAPPLLTAVLALAAAGSSAVADRVVETGYVPASRSILYEPTAYYVPTAYATTSYYVPTSYYVTTPTAYVVPTSYVEPASYVVRRYRPTTYAYVPTTYYYPTTTTLDLPVLRPTSAAVGCCDPAPTICDTPGAAASVPAAEQTIPPPAGNGSASGSGGSASNPDATGSGRDPGLDPGAVRSQPIRPRTPAGKAPANGGGTTPASPPIDTDRPLVEPPPAETNGLPTGDRRDAYKPKLSTARGALTGRVVSAVTGQPEADVTVTVANAGGRFRDRTLTTDADGRFSASLPEGDWTVRVPKSATGDATIDRDVTVSGGLVTDERDREVTLLTINR